MKANVFSHVVLVYSELISQYPGLYIGGSALPCIGLSPILFPIYKRLSYDVAYLYRLQIHFLFY